MGEAKWLALCMRFGTHMYHTETYKKGSWGHELNPAGHLHVLYFNQLVLQLTQLTLNFGRGTTF